MFGAHSIGVSRFYATVVWLTQILRSWKFGEAYL